jgi:surface protein
MFNTANAFAGDLSNWNTTSVTTMYSMFNGAISFNHDLSKWDVEAVTTMQYMFWGASAFNQKLCWTLKEDANTDYMFGAGSDGSIDCP